MGAGRGLTGKQMRIEVEIPARSPNRETGSGLKEKSACKDLSLASEIGLR